MQRKRFADVNCGIAQALDQLGDWWTLLVIRDAFFGVRRFSDFQANLGIAKNILSDRLQRLVEAGVLERYEAGTAGVRHEYRLTPKGEALLPVLTALREWSDAWVFGPGQEPVIVTERRTGRRVPPMRVMDETGRALGRRDLRALPGPGATEHTRRLLAPRATGSQGIKEE